ncbi:MAG TPA: hypothetical protein VNH83_27555 [Bryobacteraceae bacterium]|nr:hypothetical protein [Bryobacteraceae bacterium]
MSTNMQIIRDVIASLESEYGASAALRVTKHLAGAYGALRKLEAQMNAQNLQQVDVSSGLQQEAQS